MKNDVIMKSAIAYCRVSTDKQEFERQRYEILEYCNKYDYKISEFIEYKISSGKQKKERGIDGLLELVCKLEEQTVICSELSRFGRSVSEILGMVDEFVNKHNCRLIFIKENLTLDNSSSDLSSQVMLTIFALLAQLEKRLIKDRVKNALAARKAAGVILGRPKNKSKLDGKEDEIRGMFELGIKQKRIADKINCTEATLSNWLKRKQKEWTTATV